MKLLFFLATDLFQGKSDQDNSGNKKTTKVHKNKEEIECWNVWDFFSVKNLLSDLFLFDCSILLQVKVKIYVFLASWGKVDTFGKWHSRN